MPENNKFIPIHGAKRHYKQGHIIMKQGQIRASFHSIVSGQVEIYVGYDPRVRVATLGPGDFFGEMACLTGDPVSATVETISEVITMELDRDGLLQLLDTDRMIRHHIVSALVSRVRHSNVKVEEESVRARVMTQVLCREGESRYGELAGVSQFINNLRTKIKHLGAGPTPVAVIGEPGTGKRHIAARLHYESPRKNALLLFINGQEFTWDTWNLHVKTAHEGTLVLDRADDLHPEIINKILTNPENTKIVITGENLPDIQGIDVLAAPPLRDRKEDIPTLVRQYLLRAGIADPFNTLTPDALRRLCAYPYLAGNINELFHTLEQALVLAAGMPIKAEHLRLGRYRNRGSRPKIGLALGGGAVRGAAHVGVLKVLEQESIPIDLIAGTSVGSLVGGLYASGMKITEIEKLLPKVRWSSLVRPVWPRLAICENSRMASWLENLDICKDFEELSIPFACVAADVLTGEAVVLRSGCLATAIRASTAIPLMMMPVHHQGRILVDGGVVHKIPAVLARSMGADLVIAVDVTKTPEAKSQPRNLFDALFACLDMMSHRLVDDELEWADIILRPQAPVSGYSFDNAPVFFQLGEKVALENIDNIRRRFGELAEEMA